MQIVMHLQIYKIKFKKNYTNAYIFKKTSYAKIAKVCVQ